MTEKDRKLINKAIKILRADWPKKAQCKQFVLGCSQCSAMRVIEEFDSLVNNFMNTDEEMAAMEAKWERKEIS